MEQKSVNKKSHSICLENREKVVATGVEKVVSSAENCVKIITSCGAAEIVGRGLKINRYDVEDGRLELNGEADSVKYSVAKPPLLKRIFK